MFEKFVNYQIGIFAVRLNRIYAPYKRLFHILECQESGVRSQESGVRSQESGVRSQESGVRSQESGVRSQESGVRSQNVREID
jgi:hypothetical protein